MILSSNEILKIRQAIESTYDCLCDIVKYKASTNEITKRTEYEEEIVKEKEPCRISYQAISNANESDDKSNVIQTIKLFIAPEIKIDPRL